MTTRDILNKEMNPDTNPLIPGGKAAQVAADKELNTGKGADADNLRLMSKWYNPYIPGSPRQHEQ